MRDLSTPLASTYGKPKKRKAAPKKLKKKKTPSAETLRTATSSRVKYKTASGGRGSYGSGGRALRGGHVKRGYDDAYKMQMAGPRSGGRKLKKSSTTISSPTSIKMGKKVSKAKKKKK